MKKDLKNKTDLQRSTIWISTPLKNLLKIKTIQENSKSISELAETAIMQTYGVDINANPRKGKIF